MSIEQYQMSTQNPNLKMISEQQEIKTSRTISITKLAKHFGQDCLTNETETENKPAIEKAQYSQQKLMKTFHYRKLEECISWMNYIGNI